jgi:hypothetical protein
MESIKTNERGSLAAENRVWERIKYEFTTDFIVRGAIWPCRIVDISGFGYGISTRVRLLKGELVDIVDPNAKAEVVWADGNRAGLRVLDQVGIGIG